MIIYIKTLLIRDVFALIFLLLILRNSQGGVIEKKYLDEMLCSGDQQFFLNKQTTMILQLSRSRERLTGNYFANFQCQFSIISPDYCDFITVVQRMNLRTNNFFVFETCKDYVQFKDKYTYSPAICGRVDPENLEENPSGLIGSRSFNANRGILVTVKFGGEIDQTHKLFDLEISITPNDYCTTAESLKPSSKQCSTLTGYSKKCISQDFICDGMVNCGFPGEYGLDESNCPNIKVKGGKHSIIGLRSPPYLNVIQPTSNNISKFHPSAGKTVSTTPSPLKFVATTKMPISRAEIPSTTKSQYLANIEKPTARYNLTETDPQTFFILRKFLLNDEDLNITPTLKINTSVTKGTDNIKPMLGTTSPERAESGFRKSENHDGSGIHLRVPVHWFCVASSLVGILAILIFSTMLCCIFCKFRQPNAPTRQALYSPSVAVLNSRPFRIIIPDNYIVQDIPMRMFMEGHNKNVMQEHVRVLPAIALNRY